MELQDRTAEIEALVKLDKRDEAYSRATAWANEVPQDYRSHLSVALVICNFMRTNAMNLYFDREQGKQFFTYFNQAKKIADAQGVAYIAQTVQPYADKISGYAEQHKAAYKYLTAKQTVAKPKKSETKILCDKAKKLLNAAQDEFAAYKKKYTDYREALRKLENELAELTAQYTELENNPPRGLFGMQKKREEYTAEKRRIYLLQTQKQNEINSMRKNIDDTLTKAEQIKKQIASFEEDIKQYNRVIAQEKREAQSITPQELELPAAVERDFADRLDFELEQLEKMKAQIAELDEEIKQENARKDFSEYSGRMSAAPGGLADYYLDRASKRARNDAISATVRKLESQKYKLQDELAARTAFLTCGNKK